MFPCLAAYAQQNMFWRSTGGGVFQTASNWSEFQGHTTPAAGTLQDPVEAGLPASNHRAVFELLSNGTITFTGNATTADAQVLKGSAFFALGGTIWNTGSTFSILAPFVNGQNNPGFTPVTVNTTVSGGTLNTSSLLVGAGDNANVGTLTLSGATLNTTSTDIAQSGTGTLNLTSGSILNSTPTANSAVNIGGQGSSHGTVNVSGGSAWNIGPNGVLHVGGFGGSGTGTLNITSGTVSGRDLNVAINSGITGAVYVNGGSSLLTMSNGIYIGQGGTGTMSISNGGDVFSPSGSFTSVGNTGGGTGSVSISGAGSTWTAGALTISRSSSNVTVSAEGLLDTRGMLMVQNNADLDIQATGKLEATTLQIWQSGTAHLSGTVRANVINVDGPGSAVFQSGSNVTIDNGAGVGVLNITNGGAYYGAPTVALSNNGTAVATCIVNGAGSLWSLGGTYYLGAGGGLGGVSVQSGGTLAAGDLYIGANTNGTLEVLHGGSNFTSTGNVYVGGTQTQSTGNGVTGSMKIQNGANANISGQLRLWNGGTVEISGGFLQVGSLNISGGQFTTSSSVSSTGNLTVTSGGDYFGNELFLGAGGFGGASVSGNGSSINTNFVTVETGRTLTVGAGGTLNAHNISVEGGTLQNSGSLMSDGSLNVTGGGLFNSTTTLEIGGPSISNASVGGAGSEIHASSVNVRSQGVLTVDNGGSITTPVNVFGGTTNGSFGGQVNFQGTASAGTIIITASGGAATNANGGNVQFNDATTAGGSTFNISGAVASSANDGNVQFNNSATAGSSTFNTLGGTLSGRSGGQVQFNQNATAGSATFTTSGGTVIGAKGAYVQFNDTASAGNGSFTTNGSQANNTGGSYDDKNGGYLVFGSNSSAGTAHFTTNGGTVNGAQGGVTKFENSSSAASGIFVTNAGAVSGAGGGFTKFIGNSNAGNSTITNNGSAFGGSLIDGTAGGLTIFHDSSSAGNATIIANGGTSGGAGAGIAFTDHSNGESARIQVYGNGRLDISLHQGGEVQIGSVEGTGNVFLGSNTLVIGDNDLNTTFAGVVQDDGAAFESTGIHAFGGSLIKTGNGTTSLTGVSTHTGMTGVGGGTLLADLSVNASVLSSASALAVGGGTFELKGLAGTVRAQALNGLMIFSGSSSVTVNNVGTSTTLDLSSAGITRMEEGTVDFRAVTGTLGVNAIVKTAQANDASGILAPWATVNGGAALAANNGSGVIVAYTGYSDISNTIANSSNSNTRISSGSGVVSLGATTTQVHTLTQNNSSAATVDTAGKTLSTGGILVTPTAAALTIGSSAGSGTLTAGTELVLINNSANALTINSNVTGGIAMTTAGNTRLNGANSYTGNTNVESGTLTVDGSIAASMGVNLAFGSTLSGHGSVSSIGGQGTVAPGNSPGIMTATSVDPSGGMGFLFQFTQLGAPTFLSPSASGNDVLRLGSLTPFTSALNGSNTITLDFSGLTLNNGDVVLGGFYADNGGDFFAKIQYADFEFIGLGVGQKIDISTVPQTANFGSGSVNGYVTKFTLTTIGATLTPASISGGATSVLHVSGLTSGETVLIERILDQDGNGSIGAGEPLIEAYTIIDGAVTSIAGVRNTHIPGDEDLTANGAIDFHVTPALGSELGRIAGTHILRVSSPTSAFPSFTRNLALTNPTQPQTITGTVTSGGNPVPNASVILLDPATDGEFVSGVIANASGVFSVSAPVGTYMLFAVMPGFVADFNATPIVALAANASPVQNLSLIATTTTISGTVTDSISAAGLGGIQLFVESDTGLATLISTNLNGSFSVPVTAGVWRLENSNNSTDRRGYLSPENTATANTNSGAVSNAIVSFTKVTALIYGTVTNNSAQPLAGLKVGTSDSNHLYFGDTTTDAAGHYVLGATTGSWQTFISNDSPGLNGYIRPNGQGTNITGAQALTANFELTAATAHIQGTATNNSVAVANIRVGAYNEATDQFIDTLTAANGTFDLGLLAGTWAVQIESSSATTFDVVSPSLSYTLVTNQTISGVALAIQNATAHITGFVRNASNAPIPASIFAFATINSVFYSAFTQTDGSGNYSLPVINGTWTVGVEGIGDYTHPIDALANISGSNATVNFTLSKFPLIIQQPATSKSDGRQWQCSQPQHQCE